MELMYKSEDWTIEREKHDEGETYYIKHGDKVIDKAPSFEEAYPLILKYKGCSQENVKSEATTFEEILEILENVYEGGSDARN